MNICPITILFRHLVSSFSPSFLSSFPPTPSPSSRFVISFSPWRTGGRSKGGTGKPFLTTCFCHSHPCVFGWNRPSLPSPSSQYLLLLLLRPLHFTSAPTRACQTRSGILHVATWRMTRSNTHPNTSTHTHTHPHTPTRIYIIEPIINVFVNNFKAIGKLPWDLGPSGGTWGFLCRTHPRRKEVNKSKPLCARAPVLLCVNMANPAIATENKQPTTNGLDQRAHVPAMT